MEAHATCLKVECLRSSSAAPALNVLISAEQCSLHGGSLRNAHLDNLFRRGDHLNVRVPYHHARIVESGVIVPHEINEL